MQQRKSEVVIMNCQITVIKHDVVIDQYQPKGNPVACFIGQAEQHLTTALFTPVFKITGDSYEYKCHTNTELKNFLAVKDDFDDIQEIKAVSPSLSLSDQNSVSIKFNP